MSNTEYSPAPGTPQTATKAVVGTVLTAVVVFISAWIADDNGTNVQEVLTWVISALVSAGVVGGGVLQTKNKAKFGAGR